MVSLPRIPFSLFQGMIYWLLLQIGRSKAMKTWTVKTVVGADHQVAFKVPETRERLKSFEEDWNAPGMDGYDAL